MLAKRVLAENRIISLPSTGDYPVISFKTAISGAPATWRMRKGHHKVALILYLIVEHQFCNPLAITLITRFVGPTCDPPGADRTQVGPMLAPWTLLSGKFSMKYYNDAIMSAVASQITDVPMVCTTVCSGTDQRKHQSSASLAFVRGIHRWSVNSAHKGPVTRKSLHLITSSWKLSFVVHFLHLTHHCSSNLNQLLLSFIFIFTC